MKEYDNSNSGSLFYNARKETERHPDETGSATIVCPHCGETTEFWVSLWHKIAKSGREWKSLAFKKKDAAPRQLPSPASPIWTSLPGRITSRVTVKPAQAPQARPSQPPPRPAETTPALDNWNDDIPF